MKDKEKQIEEMAMYCCNTCEMGWGFDFGECAEKGTNGYKNCELAKETAEMIYNSGYRKIPKDAVVIPEKITEETSATDLIKIAKYNDAIRKQTAREIFERLLEEHRAFDNNDVIVVWQVKEVLKEIAKQFGVEVEE